MRFGKTLNAGPVFSAAPRQPYGNLSLAFTAASFERESNDEQRDLTLWTFRRMLRSAHVLSTGIQDMRTIRSRAKLFARMLQSMSAASLRQQKAELRKSIQASLKQLSSDEVAKQC